MIEISSEFTDGLPLSIEKTPARWELVKLSDIANKVESGFPSGQHSQDSTGIPHLRPMNIDRNGKINLDVVKYVTDDRGKFLLENDILFNNTNSPELIGKTAVISKKQQGFAFSNHMTRIELHHLFKDIQFFAYYLNYLWEFGYLKKRCTNHVNQASISSTTLAETVPFLLPPINEQTRIVTKLEELLSDLDAGVSELKTAQAKLIQYRQSLLKAAVEGELTRQWRESSIPNTEHETGAQLLERILQERRKRWEAKQLAKFAEQGKQPPKDWQKKYPEPVQPDTTGLPTLPEGWAWATVDQLGDVQLGKMLDKLKHQSGIKLPYLRNINVRWGSIDTKDVFDMYFEADEVEKFSIEVGDVLVCEGGEPARAAVCQEVHKQFKFQKALHRVRLYSSLESDLLVYYLEHLAKSGQISNYFTGSTIKHFTRESFISLPIPLPSKVEQHLIVQSLTHNIENIEHQKQALAFTLTQSAAQRKNILRSAFAGELVPQDPNDEPANVLLERIQAERAAQPKKAKVRQAKVTSGKTAMPQTILEVLQQARTALAGQELAKQCGIAEGATTEQIEAFYDELRRLDLEGKIKIEPDLKINKKQDYISLKDDGDAA